MHNCGLNLILILILVNLPSHLPSHIYGLLWILIDRSDWCGDVDYWDLSLIHANVGNIHVDVDGVLLLRIFIISLSLKATMRRVVGHFR